MISLLGTISENKGLKQSLNIRPTRQKYIAVFEQIKAEKGSK
jgi:hypothetical protein